MARLFKVTGSNNDINVFNQSTLFHNVLWENASVVHFEANNAHYTAGYYLTNGIYSEWPVFVKSPPFPSDENNKRFKVMQEVACRDLERDSGVLQARWTIIRGQARLWKKEQMGDLMFVCILYKLIIEDE
ncbi:uncharacterized protein LOC130998242 [Salvia miltiorrhiza]|uniref:uncharacterized protein LOC130998242 n=1 Tax=Salvia miltiorrhiza TaxID=226208 RepID=UPI0025ABDEA4|nr:uncharacterized protein LOC130998242 [Salvia miltiorrhiza]